HEVDGPRHENRDVSDLSRSLKLWSFAQGGTGAELGPLLVWCRAGLARLVAGARRIGAGQTWGIPFRKSSAAPRTRTGAAELAPCGGSDSPRLFPVRARGSRRSKFFERVSPRPAFKLQLRTTQTGCCCLFSRRTAEG